MSAYQQSRGSLAFRWLFSNCNNCLVVLFEAVLVFQLVITGSLQQARDPSPLIAQFDWGKNSSTPYSLQRILSGNGDDQGNSGGENATYYNKLQHVLSKLLNGGFDPDQDLTRNASDIIRSRGFVPEEHRIITSDGYILTMTRIVNPLISEEYRVKRGLKPVLLMHGMTESPDDWIMHSYDVRPRPYPRSDEQRARDMSIISNLTHDSQEHPNSLGFMLANEGYDVWLGTNRGSVYGLEHVLYSQHAVRFWHFSMDEQSLIDVPANIEYIREHTGMAKIGYVGHSQGGLMLFALLSELTQYNEILEPAIGLAPVVFTTNGMRIWSVFEPLLTTIGSFFSQDWVVGSWFAKNIRPLVCGKQDWLHIKLCSIQYLGAVPIDTTQFNNRRIATYLSHYPAGTSTRVISQYVQNTHYNRFAHYDFGPIGNLFQYGKLKPPLYDIKRITSRSLCVFHCKKDVYISPKDVQLLRDTLNVKLYVDFNATHVRPEWTHIDFVLAKEAGEVVNVPVLKIMNDFRDDNTITKHTQQLQQQQQQELIKS